MSGILRLDRSSTGVPGEMDKYINYFAKMLDGVASDMQVGLFSHIYLYNGSKRIQGRQRGEAFI